MRKFHLLCCIFYLSSFSQYPRSLLYFSHKLCLSFPWCTLFSPREEERKNPGKRNQWPTRLVMQRKYLLADFFFFFFWALTHLEKELLLVFSFHLKKNNKKQSGRRNMTQFLCFILIFKWSSTLCVERSLLSNASHVKPLFAAGQTISTVILIAPYSQFKNRRM